MMLEHRFIISSFLVCMSTIPAFGQELALLRKMPGDLLRYTGGARPDENGMAGHNRDGFKSPEFQRGAMHYMIRAVVRRDQRCIDEGFAAIDATFKHQTERGNFGVKGEPHGGPSAVAFWLADLGRAMLVLRESELWPKYKDRIDGVMPKIQLAARWLANPRYCERLKREDADAPNRLLFDALAFGLSGVLTNDGELKKLGGEFVELAMGRFRECDGVFLEKGGWDSSYQAVAAQNLQVWAVYFPEDGKKYAAAIDRAVAWEVGRVGADGLVDVGGNTRTGLGQETWMGREKDVNLSQVTLCLLYHHARTGNAESLKAAKRIVERRRR